MALVACDARARARADRGAGRLRVAGAVDRGAAGRRRRAGRGAGVRVAVGDRVAPARRRRAAGRRARGLRRRGARRGGVGAGRRHARLAYGGPRRAHRRQRRGGRADADGGAGDRGGRARPRGRPLLRRRRHVLQPGRERPRPDARRGRGARRARPAVGTDARLRRRAAQRRDARDRPQRARRPAVPRRRRGVRRPAAVRALLAPRAAHRAGDAARARAPRRPARRRAQRRRDRGRRPGDGRGAVTETGARPCVLDCDPGHDDAVALLLAAASPALDLRAITTVAGNGPLDRVTENARRVCTLAGIRDVPIAAGADRPLAGPLITAAHVHGESALDGPALPAPDVPLDDRPADALVAEVVGGAAEPVTLIATGPLTNVAVALERHPDLADGLREIVLMGGSTERGNHTPYAEFNILVDPEAAERVFASGVPVTMVGLNLTHQAIATTAVLDRLRTLDTELARVVVAWMTFFGSTYEDLWGLSGPPVHDACAVALVIDAGLVECVEAFVAVETEGRWTRGATVVDL